MPEVQAGEAPIVLTQPYSGIATTILLPCDRLNQACQLRSCIPATNASAAPLAKCTLFSFHLRVSLQVRNKPTTRLETLPRSLNTFT